MAYFVVSYDLKQKEWPDYTKLIEKLEKMNSIKYQKSAWLVDQNKTAKHILDILTPYIHQDDLFMVIEFSKEPEWTRALQGTKVWIAARFP